MALPINVENQLSSLIRIYCHKCEEDILRALLNNKEITKENPKETKEIIDGN